MNLEECKKVAGYEAAKLVHSGMIVGLGTGSTAKYFIEKLILRTKEEGLAIHVVASSNRSLHQAVEGGLPLADINTLSHIDLTADGADEIDSQKRMIKGGGGALLREKIVATLSKEMVIIVDETKQVPLLGKRKLPVEVVPFAHMATLRHIQKRTPEAYFREKQGRLFITDNGNYIIDIAFPSVLEDPEREHFLLNEIPGVVETGFFFHLASRVIIAFMDGQTIHVT
ncbi:MAG: ribose 5-phosphate isomerase A [Chlamydiae bacterium]|nr:ribose 5-phosphate isomerase A [Chlamydiota bacterium]